MNAPQPLPTDTGTTLKTLRTLHRGPILHVELHEPGYGNAITEAMLDDLLAVLGTPDPSVRVIVLSGSGDDFCLGGDRTEYDASLRHDPTGSGVRTSTAKARLVCEALSANAAVTIAKVHGKAIGAGLGLALACDLRVGAETASFRLPELALGLPTAWGGLLPRLLNEVGAPRVRELVLTGRAFDAREACSLGILQKVVPENELDKAVDEWARPVIRRPEDALRITKTLFNAYAAPTRLADASALDAELMASIVAARHHVHADRLPPPKAPPLRSAPVRALRARR
ncbi:enoyl-CoA hydratase/isomerase family protein [Streptomyces sp. NPDC026673]|uniref:enoyl-CoA hydratase/isomerase family protein n=1 Tax=Streptomyces sp. NPDC026673 TaxID=3155724 RepID=UPI0033EA8746